MKVEKLRVTTDIERISDSRVHVIVTCNDEEIDNFYVNPKNMLEVMMKAKDCISNCIKKLMKYK